MAAFWAGITGFVWYAFGTVPLHIAVSGQLGLTTAQSSSWMFIVWFSGALASIALSLCYRQPPPRICNRAGRTCCAFGTAGCIREIVRQHAAFFGVGRVWRRRDAVLNCGHHISILGD